MTTLHVYFLYAADFTVYSVYEAIEVLLDLKLGGEEFDDMEEECVHQGSTFSSCDSTTGALICLAANWLLCMHLAKHVL